MGKVVTAAQAARLNRTGEYGPYTAANGHSMVATLLWPAEYTDNGRRERDYRVGDEIRYSTWDAGCTRTCGACRDGDTLPDW